MNTTPQTLDDEVLREIEKPENPLKTYRVEFPFNVPSRFQTMDIRRE